MKQYTNQAHVSQVGQRLGAGARVCHALEHTYKPRRTGWVSSFGLNNTLAEEEVTLSPILRARLGGSLFPFLKARDIHRRV